jgi:hypothetical protein
LKLHGRNPPSQNRGSKVETSRSKIPIAKTKVINMGYSNNLACFDKLKKMHILGLVSYIPNTPSMQSITAKATNVSLCNIAKNEVKNEQDFEFCDEIKISKVKYHKNNLLFIKLNFN